MRTGAVYVTLADHPEPDGRSWVHLGRAIHECARVLPVTDPDRNRARIQRDRVCALILNLPEEHNSVIGRKPVHFLHRSDYIPVIAYIRYFALLISLIKIRRRGLQ